MPDPLSALPDAGYYRPQYGAFWQQVRREPAFTHYGVSKLNFDFTLDISRAQQELGYQPVVTLDDGIIRTAARLKDHGKLHR